MLVAFGRICFLIILSVISCVRCVNYDETRYKTLYVADDSQENSRQFLINRQDYPEPTHLERRKRDASTPPPASLQKNISTWTTHLNDSHQQLMVHWVGEGSNVIICLARDSSPRNKGALSSSSLFISYDYGKNFTNKTESFKLGDAPDSGYAQLDKFFNHPKYPEFCVFVDSTNKKLFYTPDNGKTIHRSDLNFHPNELAFDEEIPDKFVVLDKTNSNRTLYLTLDGGSSFKAIHHYVKAFFWSSGVDFTKAFYVERWRPDGLSNIITAGDPLEMDSATKIFEDAKDFQIKGDYMFATKESKEKNTLELYISHQRGPFHKAEFQTELDLRKFHIADVTDKRIFVSVLHRDTLVNLYVSEISNNFTQYNFVLSLDQVLCYFPDANWKDTWLEDVTEDPFTDLYRVEGLKGIYIASKVESKTPVANIGPEHLISVITFDHGVSWTPINPPTEDENGKPLTCHIENSCSLHLCQKFSQLYPVTSKPQGTVVNNNNLRSASIMSSKSAPGIIMATGVMGKSLKGIPGVYMSRDAGVTWKRILKDYYFFNYGDHGGVLVAVKYFKSRGETKNILYSTNEGVAWNSYDFNAEDLRIYGLMTEPGENTTTFTMFGSANDFHQWIIITIDLRNTFARNCTDEDYKFWSPTAPHRAVSCVLGARDTFQRRLAHTACYNGADYDRPIKKQLCECTRRDYECDYGFMLTGSHECIRNRTVKVDPYAIPAECRPGHFYERTKGYRLIDGDACVSNGYKPYEPDAVPCPLEEPQEFILVALRDKIARIDLADNATLVPVKGQKNIVALEFDIKNNCIYWADIEMDKISRQCFNDGSAQEVVVDKDLASIEGMALDWISNVLFFVDGMRKKIEAVRIDLHSQGRMRTTILDQKVLYKPRGIAVHPRAGYLFWTDWDRVKPSVSRSNLDGTDVKRLFGRPEVQWPNGITIDQMSERIYWVDAMEDYIASSDLNGKHFRKILSNDGRVTHPFAVAVLKDKVYWDDWKAKSIFIADKDTGGNVITIDDSFSGLMDLKVFAHFVQHGSNACSYQNNSCGMTSLCLGAPGGRHSCVCPDGFTWQGGRCLCHNGLEPGPNMTCPKKDGAACDSEQFACANGLCVEMSWHCDGNDDCGDGSDEAGCRCAPPARPCADRCYLPQWRCDGDADCPDKADEKDCPRPNCTDTQFQCLDGQCIEKRWLCDGDNDCKDGSDERNCSAAWVVKRPESAPSSNCSANGFACGAGAFALCIPGAWACDGERDCPGGEDELPARCANATCAPYMFQCPSGKCIYQSWVCDGENDCSDVESSDEKNCTFHPNSKTLPRVWPPDKPGFPNATCPEWMFKCDNQNCLPYWWRCDSINDCGDNSDERGCTNVVTGVATTPATDTDARKCARTQFTCQPGVCIPLSWVCDGAPDCSDGADERHCALVRRCTRPNLPCGDGGCVAPEDLCDGRRHCRNGADEKDCGSNGTTLAPAVRNDTKTPVKCLSDEISCDFGTRCVPPERRCDARPDCADLSDEVGDDCLQLADDLLRIRVMPTMEVNASLTNSSSFTVTYSVSNRKDRYNYLPSISKFGDGVWRNMSWTPNDTYSFTDLEPFTRYNVTFYVKYLKLNRVFPPVSSIEVTTKEGVPSAPRRLAVRQLLGRRVQIEWDAPASPRGNLHYTLFYRPPTPPIERYIGSHRTSVVVEGYFKPNVNYSFWLVATNDAGSSTSEVKVLTFDFAGDLDALEIVNASVARPAASSAYIEWHAVKGADGYRVTPRLPPNYDIMESVNTTHTNVTIENLPPGTKVQIDIEAYKGNVTGRPMTATVVTAGDADEVLTLTGILLRDVGTSVKLSWRPPTAPRYKDKQITYVVVYKRDTWAEPRNRDTATRNKTTETSMLIEGLHACETYLFRVGILGGPLSPILDIITRDNPKAPVKNLQIEFSNNKTDLEITWRANCDVIIEPVVYRVDIKDLVVHKTSHYSLLPTDSVTNAHRVQGVPAGAKLQICVRPDVPDSIEKCVFATSAMLSAPAGVSAWRAPTGDLTVLWEHDHEDTTQQHKYQVIISTEEIPDDLSEATGAMRTAVVSAPPALLSSLAPEAPEGGALYVAVRAVASDGHYGDLSEVKTLQMEAVTGQDSSMAGMWWGGGVAIVVVVALLGALVHAALRHRRLARSFLRLASHTPRYDSRRGQATIGDHDDDDVPPIHGFSDDEPLVIA